MGFKDRFVKSSGTLAQRCRGLFRPSKVKEDVTALAHLLRAQGLDIINAGSRSWRAPEPVKPVLRKSLWVALSRCSIHVVPMGVLSFLIALNYNMLYIGPGFGPPPEDTIFMAMLQVGAKVIELLCVASLTTIVFQALRHELFDAGVPIGLLGAGMNFTRVSMFWSPDFIAALPFSGRSWTRARLLLLLVLAGSVALTIGPASAVLMIPRQQLLPIGSTKYFLNGTADQFWPKVLAGEKELEVCRLPNATKYAVCPGGGYEPLRSGFNSINYTSYFIGDHDPWASKLPSVSTTGGYSLTETWPWTPNLVRNAQWLLPAAITSLTTRGSWNQTAVIQPHAASIIMNQQLLADFKSAIGASAMFPRSSGLDSVNEYHWMKQFVAYSITNTPQARVWCNGHVEELSADAKEVHFPFLTIDSAMNYTFYSPSGPKPFEISALNRSESSQLRAQWTSLPIDDFGLPQANVSVSGILIELPWTNQSSRLTLSCAITASWREADSITLDTQSSHMAWSLSDEDLNTINPVAGKIPIKLETSWLDLLWPIAPQSDQSSNDSTRALNTLEQMLVDSGYPTLISRLRSSPQLLYKDGACALGMMNSSATDAEIWNDQACQKGRKTQFIEILIGSMLADGLSRQGSWRQYNTTDPDVTTWLAHTLPTLDDYYYRLVHGKDAIILPPADSTLVVQSLSVSIAGWSYYASSTSDYLATAVVAIYLLIAATHMAWVLLGRRVTSSAWDSLTELLALCYNSPPPQGTMLKNTSAGIERLGTYSHVVRVRAAQVPKGDDDADASAPQVVLVMAGDGPDASSARLAAKEKKKIEDKDEDLDEDEPLHSGDPSSNSSSAQVPMAQDEGALESLVASAQTTAIVGSTAGYHGVYRRSLHRVEVDKLYS